MKITEACKKAGCKKDMYCFGGKDTTMEHQLCSTAVLYIWNSLVEKGKVLPEDIDKIKGESTEG